MHDGMPNFISIADAANISAKETIYSQNNLRSLDSHYMLGFLHLAKTVCFI